MDHGRCYNTYYEHPKPDKEDPDSVYARIAYLCDVNKIVGSERALVCKHEQHDACQQAVRQVHRLKHCDKSKLNKHQNLTNQEQILN